MTLPIAVERGLHDLFSTVGSKRNNTAALVVQARRVAHRSPEVLVKITGFGKGVQHIQSHLSYISRNGKLALETDRGEVLDDQRAIKAFLRQWTEEIDNARRHKNQRDTMHLVLSMPEGTPETAVSRAARTFAKKTFAANHEYVFALHTDEPHPHVHLTVKMFGFNGKRLNPRKADLQGWREDFACRMRDQGIDAEATPRSVRGVVRKAERGVVRHIERGDERHDARPSRANAARTKEAAEELIAETNGEHVPNKPWDARIAQRQRATRQAWLAIAASVGTDSIPYKEHHNVPPNYDRLDLAKFHASHRAAAVYQSDLEGLGLGTSTVTLAGVRDLSRLDVVQHQRSAQVFLYTHASIGLGRDSATDHDLRRTGTRTSTVATGAGGDRQGRAGRLTDWTRGQRGFGESVLSFVRSMPPIATERDELKRGLIQQFTGLEPDRQVLSTESALPRGCEQNVKSIDR